MFNTCSQRYQETCIREYRVWNTDEDEKGRSYPFLLMGLRGLAQLYFIQISVRSQ